MKKSKVLIKILIIISFIISEQYVKAGSLNQYELSIISIAKSEFEYNNEIYIVSAEYISELVEYLMQDDVDLTQEQADQVRAEVENNIQTGVDAGYLVKKQGALNKGQNSETKDNEVNKDENSDIKDNDVNKDENSYIKDNDVNKDENSDIKDNDVNKNKDSDVKDNDVNKNKDSDVKDNEVNKDENSYIKDNEVNKDENSYIKDNEVNKDENSDIKDNEVNKDENSDIKDNDVNKDENSDIKDSEVNKGEDSDIKDSEVNKDENSDVKDNDVNKDENSDIKDNDVNKDEDSKSKDNKKSEDISNNTLNDNSNLESITVNQNNTLFSSQNIYKIIIIIIIIVMLIIFILNKKNISKIDFKMIDMHTHILPNVDDGSKSMSETIQMLHEAYNQGINKIIVTPHFNIRNRQNVDKILDLKDKIQQEAYKINSDLKIFLGNEVYYNHGIDKCLEQKEIFTLNNTRYILVEFNIKIRYSEMYKDLQTLIYKGYIPVLAHIERYECLYKNIDKIQELIQLGVYTQMNCSSLIGSVLNKRVLYCRNLFNKGLIHIISSDCHDMKTRKIQMKKCLYKLIKSSNEKLIRKAFFENAQKLLDDKFI